MLGLFLLNDTKESTYIAHNGKSTIDLVFVSEDLIPETELEVIPTVERKHQKLVVTSTAGNRMTATKGKRPKESRRKIAEHKLAEALASMRQEPNADPDSIYEQLIATIECAAKPSLRQRSKNKPWYDKECHSLKQSALSEINTEEYDSVRKVYKATIKRKRTEHELAELERRVEASKSKPWIILPGKKRPSVPRIGLPVFEKYYGDLYKHTEHAESANNVTPPAESIADNGWYNQQITKEEVTQALNRMKRRKATGPDGTAADIFKDNAILLPLVTKLFNSVLESGNIPKRWRTSYVTPIYKGKGSADDPANYRCISLASHVPKLFTSILSNRLLLQCLPQLSDNQHGFLPDRSCETAFQSLMDYIDREKAATYVAFIDFKAAFDNVERGKLIAALKSEFGIEGKILRALASFLQPNSLIVDNGADLSQPVSQQKGVQQGDSCSPLLFIMFMSDLLRRLEKRKVLPIMYADDLAVASHKLDDVQGALTVLATWCKDNKMIVNIDKSKVVKFRKAGALGKQRLYLNRKPMEFVSSIRYLGLTLQPALGFSSHVDQLLTKTAATIACLGDLQELPLSLAMRIYDMKVMPMIRYGMSCVSNKLSQAMVSLDKCKTTYLKSVLGLSRYTSNTFVLELAERRSLCEDLSQLGYRFQTDTWINYTLHLTEKRAKLRENNLTDGPAFFSKGWKNGNRTDRQAICRLTYHGFHHTICARKDFYTRPEMTCTCIYCGEMCTERLHLLYCTFFTGHSLTSRVRKVTKAASN